MKPALLVFLAALTPAFSAAQPVDPDPVATESAKIQAQLAHIRALQQEGKSAPAPLAAEPASPPASAASPAAVAASEAGLPLLYLRLMAGTNGYTLEQLTKNMNWTEKNIGELVDFIHPWKKGAKVPSPEQVAAARKALAKESAAADGLIKEADIALAKGIPRDPPPAAGMISFSILGYLSRPVPAYVNPTPEEKADTYAVFQSNVLGHEAALIAQKQSNASTASEEADTEKWLAQARQDLAAAKQAPSPH